MGEPQPFAHMDPKPKSGSCENVLTLKQVGQIFKAGAGKYAKYCMEAVIVAAGECGPCTPGTCRWPQLWGAGSTEEPATVTRSAPFATCTSWQTTKASRASAPRGVAACARGVCELFGLRAARPQGTASPSERGITC